MSINALAAAAVMMCLGKTASGEALDTLKRPTVVPATGPVTRPLGGLSGSAADSAKAWNTINAVASILHRIEIDLSLQELEEFRGDAMQDVFQTAVVVAVCENAVLSVIQQIPAVGQVHLTAKQIDYIIASMPPDTTVRATRFLKSKLIQLKNRRPPG
jgi:hypothetical protein